MIFTLRVNVLVHVLNYFFPKLFFFKAKLLISSAALPPSHRGLFWRFPSQPQLASGHYVSVVSVFYQ